MFSSENARKFIVKQSINVSDPAMPNAHHCGVVVDLALFAPERTLRTMAPWPFFGEVALLLVQ